MEGTGQPSAPQDPEIGEIEQMFADRGIEIDWSDDDEPEGAAPPPAEEPEPESEPQPVPQAAAPQEPDDEAGLNPAQRGFKRREAARRMREMEGELKEKTALLETIMRMAREARQAPPPVAAAAPPAPIPDPLEDPDGYFAAKAAPLLQQIEELKTKLGEREQGEKRREEIGAATETIERMTDEHEKAFPGYRERSAEFRDLYLGDMEAAGVPREVAARMLADQLGSIFKSAVALRIPPQVLHEIHMQRYRKGAAAPAAAPPAPAPKAPPKPSRMITEANRAAGSTVAGSAADGGAPAARTGFTPEAARSGEFGSLNDVRELLSKPGGRDRFWMEMERLERT